MANDNVFKQWVDRYHPDPVLFVQEVLGVDPDPWQIEFLRAIARGGQKDQRALWPRCGKVHSVKLGHAVVLHDPQPGQGGGDSAHIKPTV